MYDWVAVVRALHATHRRRASLLPALWWEPTRDLGRARMFLHALRASD